MTQACRICAALPSTQSSRVALTISMIVAMPRPGSPTSQASAPSYSTSAEALDRLPSLSLSRWMRMALRLPSGSTRGSRKQDRPSGAWASTRNRSHMRRRAEPLVPGEQVAAVARRRVGHGPGGVGPDVRAALLLGHRHPGQQAGLAVGHGQAGLVGARGQQRLVAGGQGGLVAQGRHAGVGHRDRAAVAGLGLGPDEELGRPGHVRAGPLVGPGRGVQAVPDRGGHQLVPGRMEVDLVDPVAARVVGAQHRLVHVGQPGLLLGAGRAGQQPSSCSSARAQPAPSRSRAASRAASAATS